MLDPALVGRFLFKCVEVLREQIGDVMRWPIAYNLSIDLLHFQRFFVHHQL
jgi:hypothetical protein